MLPSVLPTETDHVPVLADEVVAALAPAPGDTIVDGTFGAGGHASLLAKRLRGEGKVIAIDRDETVTPFFERFRRETGVKARLLHGEFSSVLAPAGRQRCACRHRPARPRRLVDADRPSGTRLLLRGRRSARHAHGSERRVLGARARQRGVRARSRRHLPPLRGRAARALDRARNRPPARRAAVRPDERARRDDQVRRFRPRRGSARAIRPSASFRRSASR